ncbi:hypothetical protein [Roseomonas harenae]|uniref:hypothetical protein n=1 Tax=Muricoccus harenae TaxID=2692566 RepID=UPI001331AD32|nr:hypothetical protein [Roseomonas harenae]
MRLAPPSPPPGGAPSLLRGRRLAWLASGVALVALGIGAAFWARTDVPSERGREVPGAPAATSAALVPAGAPAAPALAPPVETTAVPLMERDALLRWQPAETTLLRLADLPAVFLVAFPDLRRQGLMMNRLAALIEKTHTPRDRVLNDEALAAAIAAAGEDPDTYYYGHNYNLADVERFMAMARASGVALNTQEAWLEAHLPMMRTIAGGGPAAIITLPAEERRFDASARRAVLEHEAGHGLFFTDPAFAAHVMRAWREAFTEADRENFRRFLAKEGYDTRNETLMANEAMAYLLFTPDTRFFDPLRDLGVDATSADRMRAAMRPPGR